MVKLSLKKIHTLSDHGLITEIFIPISLVTRGSPPREIPVWFPKPPGSFVKINSGGLSN